METNLDGGVKLAAKPLVAGPGTSSSEITDLISGIMDVGGAAAPVPQAGVVPGSGAAPAAAAAPVVPAAPEAPAQPEAPAAPAAPEKSEAPAAPVAPERSIIPDDVLGVRPAAKPEEARAEEVDEPVPVSVQHDDKANKAWQKIKQERKELRDKVRAQEAELKRLSETAAPAVEAEEVAKLQNAVKDYEAKLAKYDLAETAAFKERFDKPMGATLQRGVSVLVRFGKTADEAKTLMRQLVESGKTPEQLSEMIAGEPYQLQGALVNLVAEFDELAKARADALGDWKSTQAALKVQARRDSEIQLMEDVERDASAALQQVVKAGNWMYARSDQNPEWNEQVDQRIQAVKGILRSGKPQDIITLVMEGATAMDTRKLAMALNDQVRDLQGRLQKLVQASPRLGGGAPPPPSAEAGDPARPRSPAEIIDGVFGRSPAGHPLG